MEVHVNRQAAAADELLREVIDGELMMFRAELVLDKGRHAMFLSEGLDGVKKRLIRAFREASAMRERAEGRKIDSPSQRLGLEESALLYWSAACADWENAYGGENPKKFLDRYEPPPEPSPYPDPDEKFDVSFRPDVTMPGGSTWIERNFETTRNELKGVTMEEFGRLGKFKEGPLFESSGKLMRTDDPVPPEREDPSAD